MSQELLSMIARMGGADGIAAMASKVGIAPAQAESAVAALVPMLAGGMAKAAQGGQGDLINQLAGAAAGFTGSAASDEAAGIGGNILSSIFGGQDVTQAVATQAAAKSGLDPAKLMALMPMVATLAASALGNGTGTVGQGAGGGLGGLLSGLLGGGNSGGAASALMAMVDQDKDGNPLDDVMRMLGR